MKQKKKSNLLSQIKRLYDFLERNVFHAIGLIIYLLIFALISIINKENSFGFLLAIASIIITFFFELYEWICLFKKDKLKKHSFFPFVGSSIALAILLLIISLFDGGLKAFENFQYNNLLCAGTLFIYVLLMTIRKIIEDKRSK